MRRWLLLVAKCYPRPWRERYGVEFDALMEDVEPDWREFTNVLGGAVKLQLQSGTALWRFAGVTALLGMLASVGAWKIAPGRYVSTAQVRITPAPGTGTDQILQELEMTQREVLSRSSLVEIIQRPSLDLYRGERQGMPVEDVIQQMRRDIEIRREGRDGSTFRISFAYPNRFKAQAVTRELLTTFFEQNVKLARHRDMLWQEVWKEHAPPVGKLEVASPATDPRDPESRLTAFLAWGLGAGLLLGLLGFATMRQPRVVRQLALCGLAGCALAGAASFLLPEVYVSEAVMRVSPPTDPKRWYAVVTPEPVSDSVRRLEKAVRGTLKHVRAEDIRVEMISSPLTAGEPPNTFRVSATAESGFKAQTLVRGLVMEFMMQKFAEAQAQQGEELRYMAERKLGPNLELLDPASLPQTHASPNRAAIAGAGLVAGLLAGALLAWCRRPRDPEVSVAVAQPV